MGTNESGGRTEFPFRGICFGCEPVENGLCGEATSAIVLNPLSIRDDANRGEDVQDSVQEQLLCLLV